MGLVLVKQGFLGLGQPIKKWYCDKCGKECANEYCRGSKDYCRTCANSVDPEIVHMWSPDEIVRKYKGDSFFIDTSDGKEKFIEWCNDCLGLLVVERNGSKYQRFYYRVGSDCPVTVSYQCIPHTGYDKSGNIKKQICCEHKFIIVGSSKKIDQEAHSKYNHMMLSRNSMVESMYGTDEIDIQYLCFGSTYFWCNKCGLNYKLNPQREHILPKLGII